MKLVNVARLTVLLFISAPAFTFGALARGLAVTSIQFRRLGWIVEHPILWSLGWWLWLFGIFGWLGLSLLLIWTLFPQQRIQCILQSAFLVVAAVLAAVAALFWMATLPMVAQQQSMIALLPWIDSLALRWLGLALFLAGATTVWIGIDAWRVQFFPTWVNAMLVVSGLLVLPSPFLFPYYWHVVIALLCWLVWCAYLALQNESILLRKEQIHESN